MTIYDRLVDCLGPNDWGKMGYREKTALFHLATLVDEALAEKAGIGAETMNASDDLDRIVRNAVAMGWGLDRSRTRGREVAVMRKLIGYLETVRRELDNHVRNALALLAKMVAGQQRGMGPDIEDDPHASPMAPVPFSPEISGDDFAAAKEAVRLGQAANVSQEDSETYFLIRNYEWQTHVTEHTKDELLTAIQPLKSTQAWPSYSDTSEWGNSFLIIRGEVVVPRPQHGISGWEID